MSVQTAHNIVMQLGLSPKERKELAKLLSGNPGKPATRHEEFKEDFKERLRRIAERKNLVGLVVSRGPETVLVSA